MTSATSLQSECALSFGWLSFSFRGSCNRRRSAALPRQTAEEPEPEAPDITTGTTGGNGLVAAAPADQGHIPASQGDLRIYIILKWPGRPDLEGIVEGEAASTWGKLIRQMPNQRLTGSGILLRKVPSRQEAQTRWAKKRHLRAADSPELAPVINMQLFP